MNSYSSRKIRRNWKNLLKLNKENIYKKRSGGPTAIKPRSASTTSSSLARVRPSIVPSLRTKLMLFR